MEKYYCKNCEEAAKGFCIYDIRQSKIDPFNYMVFKTSCTDWSKSSTMKGIYNRQYIKDTMIDTFENVKKHQENASTSL